MDVSQARIQIVGSFVGVWMLEVAVMIEGQYGLNWERWKRLSFFLLRCADNPVGKSPDVNGPSGPLH